MGFFWALVTGEWGVSLSMGVFFELFWLDLFPAGTYIPPNSAASMLLSLAAARYLGLTSPEYLVVPMAISLPAATLGAHVEYFQRQLQNRSYNAVINWGRKARPSLSFDTPGARIASALLQLFIFKVVFFLACLLVLIGVLNGLRVSLGHLPVATGLTWGHLWFAAALGGVLALRVRRSYAFFIATLLVVVLGQSL